MLCVGDAETATFYAATKDGSSTSLAGLFKFAAISKHQKFAEGSSFEDAMAEADHAMAGTRTAHLHAPYTCPVVFDLS